MKKDFKKWHSKKEILHKEKERPFFHEGEVWFCSLGVNIGFEQDGTNDDFLRPVIILKKFNKEVCLTLPLTRSYKKGRCYFSFKLKGMESVVILSQVRLIDGKRLQYKAGNIKEADFIQIRKRLAQLIA